VFPLLTSVSLISLSYSIVGELGVKPFLLNPGEGPRSNLRQ